MYSSRQQSGFALLVFMVTMIGAAGFALTGYMEKIQKEVDKSHFQKNKKILNQAKDALLQFAYNYPVTSGNGPGRLPCADIDNDGDSNTAFGDCIQLGRFPFANPLLHVEELRDASGERLWYAVSENFATNVSGGNIVNSDSVGSITVKDQSGAVIYDGSIDGVAAVIIAPGAPVKRSGTAQDRSVSNTDNPFDLTADTDTGIIDADNYLDIVGTQDNSTFTQGDNDDGFILGPVGENEETITVNDQVIIVTSEEVIAMAEKAVLQAYRDAIDSYQTRLWGLTAANYRYPWLNDYQQINASALNVYDADPATSQNVGRIPSIFSDYFVDVNSDSVVSDIDLTYDVTITIDETSADDMDVFDGVYSQVSSVQGRASMAFTNTNTGRLLINSGTTNTGGYTGPVIYFWDEYLTPDGWEECRNPAVTGNWRDCNQSSPGVFVADPVADDNLVPMRVRKITLKADFDQSSAFEFDYSPAPTISYAAPTATLHAKITASFAAGKVTEHDDFVFFDYEQDNYYNLSFDPTDTSICPDLNPCGSTGFISSSASTIVSFDQFDIELDYFPELPVWAGSTNDNWNSSVLLAYADNYEPGGSGADCTPATDCLDAMINISGNKVNKKSLLVIAGDIPADIPELLTIFDGDNNAPDEHINTTLNTGFDYSPVNGDDSVLVLDEI